MSRLIATIIAGIAIGVISVLVMIIPASTQLSRPLMVVLVSLLFGLAMRVVLTRVTYIPDDRIHAISVYFGLMWLLSGLMAI